MAVDGDDRRLVDHDPPASHHDESVCRTQVNRDVVGKKAEQAGEWAE